MLSAIDELKNKIDKFLNEDPEDFNGDYLRPTQEVLDRLVSLIAMAFPGSAPCGFALRSLGDGDIRLDLLNHKEREFVLHVSERGPEHDYIFYGVWEDGDLRADVVKGENVTPDELREKISLVVNGEQPDVSD